MYDGVRWGMVMVMVVVVSRVWGIHFDFVLPYIHYNTNNHNNDMYFIHYNLKSIPHEFSTLERRQRRCLNSRRYTWFLFETCSSLENLFLALCYFSVPFFPLFFFGGFSSACACDITYIFYFIAFIFSSPFSFCVIHIERESEPPSHALGTRAFGKVFVSKISLIFFII